ncbi:MAG: universal stress protein [Rhodoblastus sp.]|nr:universal stress protein [Rhodoblastus sp.]
MAIKTVLLGLLAEDVSPPDAVVQYNVALCDSLRAHLACKIIVPMLDLPAGRLVPLAQAVVDELNDERCKRAEDTIARLKAAALVSGVTADAKTLQAPYAVARADLITAARAADLIVLPQSKGVLSFEAGLVEGVLFGAGRPVLVVPAEWDNGCQFRRIVVAWDGGARAARAVGDALPFIEMAEDVEVVCVADRDARSIAGADVTENLARHCRRVRLTELPVQHDDAGWTLRDHVDYVKPDLLVMGAYAHARVIQFVIGGVTSQMLQYAKTPVLYSY